LQDGFGWTNGVLRRLLVLYPREEPLAAQAWPAIASPGLQAALATGGMP
jgi:hypothetical protein